MARVPVGHPRVGALVEKLTSLFLRTPSVNAMCDALNTSLRARGVQGAIYPNRLHALLSGDLSRGLNEASITLLEQAVVGLDAFAPSADVERHARGVGILQALERRWRAIPREADLPAVARDVGVPVAIAAQLLGVAMTNGALERDSTLEGPTLLPTSTRAPDWSYQRVARDRCLAALRIKPGRRVGLIVPTGGGKTRIALSVGLHLLAEDAGGSRKIVWVTHRHNLHAQARRDLQAMLNASDTDLPVAAAALLAKRFEFLMLSEVSGRLADAADAPLLIIIDEAHRAAARSYDPIFEALPSVPVLSLTATPNRTDGRAIRIDEVSFSISFSELVARGVIVEPEFRNFDVEGFDWSLRALDDLADMLISAAQNDFTKTLVITPTIERVEDFHAALVRRLVAEPGHILAADDIGFLHSRSNSLGVSSAEFLADFAERPRGILVSAQMLLEGFDDPQINTVVITYPSTSLVLLMQAAGRCVRWHPNKRRAFVVQARNDALAYHFEQRWLYQEISDFLRPALVDVEYADGHELRVKITSLLADHYVDEANARTVLARISNLAPGQKCRVLLCGLPYFGAREDFAREASWSAVVETPSTTDVFRALYNDYCALGADLALEAPFLREYARRFGFTEDSTAGSDWQMYTTMLISMREARREIFGDVHGSVLGPARPYIANRATTWLRYVTFHYRPTVPVALRVFLEDCHNRDAIMAAYQTTPSAYALAVKLPLPLGGAEAELLDGEGAAALADAVTHARDTLGAVAPAEQYDALQRLLRTLPAVRVPLRMLVRLEQLVGPDAYDARTLALPQT